MPEKNDYPPIILEDDFIEHMKIGWRIELARRNPILELNQALSCLLWLYLTDYRKIWTNTPLKWQDQNHKYRSAVIAF